MYNNVHIYSRLHFVSKLSVLLQPQDFNRMLGGAFLQYYWSVTGNDLSSSFTNENRFFWLSNSIVNLFTQFR